MDIPYSIIGVSESALKKVYLGWFSYCCGHFQENVICFFKVPMALRPCNPGDEYRGPVRIPVTRTNGEKTFPGVSYRPTRQFFKLRSADYYKLSEHYKKMAEDRRAERHAEQEKLKTFGPDISQEDTSGAEIDASCKILKHLEHSGMIRLYYRRKDPVINYHYDIDSKL